MTKKVLGFFVFLGRYSFALFWSAYLFLFGFVFKKNRVFIDSLCALFYKQFREKKQRLLVPSVSLQKIVPETLNVAVLELMEAVGNISFFELFCISKIVKWAGAKKVFEIGTFDGRTTLNLATNIPSSGMVYTLDLPKESKPVLPIVPAEKVFIEKGASGTRFAGTRFEKKIFQLFGDSANFDFSEFIGKIDLVFIDGSHSFEYVLNDSKIAFKMLRDNGIVVWHDYGSWDGVTKALNLLFDKGHSLLRIEGTSLVIAKSAAARK